MTYSNNKNMEAFVSGLKVGLVIFGGTLFAYIPINYFAAADLSNNSTIELKTVCAVGVFGGSVIWWLGKKFQKIDDRLEALEVRNKKKDGDYEV